MDKKLNIAAKLDFSEIDLTAPEFVITETLKQIAQDTNEYILGDIKSYNGPIHSYIRTSVTESIRLAIGETSKEIDIQSELGEIGTENKKFECYLYTPVYKSYKFRVFFMQYGIANYPVTIILQEDVANSISENGGYIFNCDSKDELEALLYKIFTSKKIIRVMQELIRINQSKRIHNININYTVDDNSANTEND